MEALVIEGIVTPGRQIGQTIGFRFGQVITDRHAAEAAITVTTRIKPIPI